MKAIVYSNCGSPIVLKSEEIEKPTPGDDEVLIKVRAASVNPTDWHLMRGELFFARPMMGGCVNQRSHEQALIWPARLKPPAGT